MTETSKEELSFLKDLLEMRNELPLIGKTTKAFKYKYATLEDVQAAWEPVFSKHGFVLRQSIEAGMNGEFDIVTTKLTHVKTGLSEEASITLPVSSDYQQIGAGLTYYKRYLLVTLGKQVCGEDFDGLKAQVDVGSDDDGQVDEPKKASKKKSPGKKANGLSPVTQEELVAVDAGPHVAYEEFLKDCEDMSSLMAYYHKNEVELSELKKSNHDIWTKCVDAFAKRKAELGAEG